jgi:hypothetical protein
MAALQGRSEHVRLSGPVWTHRPAGWADRVPGVDKGPPGPQNYIAPAQDLQRGHGPLTRWT